MPRSFSPPARTEWGLIAPIALLLVYSAWMRGGTFVPLQSALPWIGGLILLSLFLIAWMQRGRHRQDAGTGGRVPADFWKEPILYLGAAFLLLLALQWWNAGRELRFNAEQGAWRFTLPPHPALPSAVSRPEAAEMLRWFFPAGCLLMVLRSRLMGSRSTRVLFWVMSVNAALLSVFGMVQMASGTNAIYWSFPQDSEFFASFGYANHAAEFFLLLFALSAGLFVRELMKPLRGRARSVRASVISGIATLLCFLGVHLSLSRNGVILAWIFLVGCLLYGARIAWPGLRPAARVNAVASGMAVCCLAFLFVSDTARTAFFPVDDRLNLRPVKELDARWSQIDPAMRIWREYPLFGVGGWGYRHTVGLYAPVDRWNRLGRGTANVHCDAVQFLCEFGTVGFLLISGTIAALAVPVIRRPQWTRRNSRLPLMTSAVGNPLLVLPLAGGVLVLGTSLVDLPFRSPAILYHWLAIIASLPKLARME